MIVLQVILMWVVGLVVLIGVWCIVCEYADWYGERQMAKEAAKLRHPSNRPVSTTHELWADYWNQSRTDAYGEVEDE